MSTFMLWLIGQGLTLEQGIDEAITGYKECWGFLPNVCWVHPKADGALVAASRPGTLVRVDNGPLPDLHYVGLAVEQLPTVVTHVNSPIYKEAQVVGIATYIGRAVPRRSMKGSKWANPFPISAELSRADAVAKYRAWITTQPNLVDALPELIGRVLGCWCHPEPCHGDVLVELVNQLKLVDDIGRQNR